MGQHKSLRIDADTHERLKELSALVGRPLASTLRTLSHADGHVFMAALEEEASFEAAVVRESMRLATEARER